MMMGGDFLSSSYPVRARAQVSRGDARNDGASISAGRLGDVLNKVRRQVLSNTWKSKGVGQQQARHQEINMKT